jgi:hypothetical protein
MSLIPEYFSLLLVLLTSKFILYKYYVSGHPSSCFYLKQRFRDWRVRISGHLRQRVRVRVRVRVTLRPTVSQSVCLGVEPRPGLMTRF